MWSFEGRLSARPSQLAYGASDAHRENTGARRRQPRAVSHGLTLDLYSAFALGVVVVGVLLDAALGLVVVNSLLGSVKFVRTWHFIHL